MLFRKLGLLGMNLDSVAGYSSHLFFDQNLVNSINHEYKEWDEKNPQVTTCNKDTKNLVQGTAIPQEVDKDKEIVFTYDVTFKVVF